MPLAPALFQEPQQITTLTPNTLSVTGDVSVSQLANGTYLIQNAVFGTPAQITSGIIVPNGTIVNVYQSTSATTSPLIYGKYFANSTTTGTSTTLYNSFGSNFNIASSAYLDYPVTKRKGPLIKKSVKSSIKRALKLISNFGMEEDVRIFLGGECIEVSHPDSIYKFVMTKRYSNLLRATEFCGHHTPYVLELYTKTDVFVADLCVYMKQTPLLDQVLALSMFVKSGCEEEILRAANYNKLNRDIEFRKVLAGNDSVMQKKLKVDEVEYREDSFTFNNNVPTVPIASNR